VELKEEKNQLEINEKLKVTFLRYLLIFFQQKKGTY